jgi:hypothetical protein
MALSRLRLIFDQLAAEPPPPPPRLAASLPIHWSYLTAADDRRLLGLDPWPIAGDLAALIADEQVVLDAMESADFAT